jgi:hypothetical protein
MNRTSRLLLASFAISLAWTSCTKYEQDGSLLHFRSPEKRLVGEWESASVTEVGVDADTNVTEFLTSSNLRLVAMFEADGSVIFENVGEELVYEGEWSFNDDNSVLHLNLESLKGTGPFFLDEDSLDRTSELEAALAALQSNDTLFFTSGTYQDVTSDVIACVNMLSATGLTWTLEMGNGANGELTVNGVTYTPGDNVSEWVNAVIDDSLGDWMDNGTVSGPDDFDGIVSSIAGDYGATVSYFFQKNPVLTGMNDPNLLSAVAEQCGLVVDIYTGSPEELTDDAVLGYVNDNNDFEVSVSYGEQLRVLDVYWQILELELDDLQAYQFREYVEGEGVYDYSFLLRFEKR